MRRKNKTLLYAVCCLLTFSLSNTTKANKQDSTLLVKHFTSCLSSEQPAAYTKSKPIKWKDTEKYQTYVWNVWKSANSQTIEERLISLDSLCEKNKGKWQLPASLEPHATMPYYYGKKGDTKPADGYPLFIYTHGSGPKEQEWKTGLALGRMFDDAPSVYFIPQIPNEGEYYRWWQKSKQYAWEKLLRQTLLSGDINANRIYLFGISEGGYGSQRLASFYADYLAAAGPMAGGEPLKNAPAENCANIAFSLRTGNEDYGFYRNMLTQCVKKEFKRLQQLHPSHYKNWVELIPDMGHHIDYRPTTVWMKQFTRNPYPTYFYWEDFEMDGRHRKGFYNLVVNERPEKEGRTCYEMNITENHIALNINNVTYETTQKDPRWGIELTFKKHFTPATKGRFTLYLCQELVDLKKSVTVTVNGKEVFKGKVKPDLKHMVNSCATFYDPCRLFPAAIEITL